MSQRGMEIFSGTLRWIMGSIIVTAAMFLVFAGLLWVTGLSEAHVQMYALISCGVGCALCGLGGGRLMGKRGLLWGVAYGVLFLLAFLSALFGMTGGIVFPSILRPGFALCILAAGLAGALGVNLRKE